jgi:hypothetical protein
MNDLSNMKKNNIYLGETLLKTEKAQISGEFVTIDDERYYRISNYNHMPDFFMTIVSDSDHWMFISSNGSLSAGRKDRNNALFPYYTDDKITDYRGITGSITLVLAEKDGKTFLWEPFSKELSNIYQIERNLYKSQYGDKIIFEEINKFLNLSFHYSWSSSDRFGFVKKSRIKNIGDASVRVEILDGINNILPCGVDYNFQNEYSNLLDGYKKNELLAETGLGLFMLSSIPVDRAEPSESLNATTVWSAGLSDRKILISNRQLEHFRNGMSLRQEDDVRASRGAYFNNAQLDIEPGKNTEWLIVAEVNQTTTKVADLNQLLKTEKNIYELVQNDIREGTSNLIKIVAASDGMQSSGEELCTARHFSNVLFNVMRGGIYLANYMVDATDFRQFVHQTNKKISKEFDSLLNGLPQQLSNSDLIHRAYKTSNQDFIRICYEYLPLTFSRRHGDPSRPWNQFSIENRNEDGTMKTDFQGNWRDIFQNWEALSFSYPEFIENIISKFVNATTPDGYNPYRIMRNGIDWETPDPDDPWSFIGYWGDHQIIYLQKLLELSINHHPAKLEELLSQEIFTFANVPYRIKSYDEIRKHPKDTIVFDSGLNKKIKSQVVEIGADGRLLLDGNANVYHVNLTEKIFVTLLAKLSNFIPEAGIWLNTQRPEWNDANNALVGNGASMVTLYYLRRFMKFWHTRFSKISMETIQISVEVKSLFDSIYDLFNSHTDILKGRFTDMQRRQFADSLGEAGWQYRNTIYSNSFSGQKIEVQTRELAGFMEVALKYIDHSIRTNLREDGLYHSYNLISFNEKGISIRHLYEMLEGQVAVLNAGYLTAGESLSVLDSLRSSKLFRKDQYSYLLYPDRQLPRFSEKNNIPKSKVTTSKLLSKLIENKENSILSMDASGHYHFNGTFRNAAVVNAALNSLDSDKYGALLESERSKVLEIYEEMFDHQSFTGRSGTFYAYEGLGSIYWHMVSKLLLAAEECFFSASDEGAVPEVVGRLKDHYYEIKAGIGLYKSPELYGAFPTDAYSHTPGNSGVKQPGMTGQVKEDIISRMGELGVRVIDGEIIFDTKLINQMEFLDEQKVFDYYASNGEKQRLTLNKHQLGFTLYQKPVIYTRSDKNEISVLLNNGKKTVTEGNALDKELSRLIFSRSEEVKLVEVTLKN